MNIAAINDFLFHQQHWVTFLGFVATILGLWFSYRKMKNRIDRYREQMRIKLAIANIATVKAIAEQLLGVPITDDKGNLQRQLMHLSETLGAVIELTNFADTSLKSALEKSLRKLRLFEKRSSQDMHSNTDQFNKTSFIDYLLDLLALVRTLENMQRIEGKGMSHGS